ILLRVIPHRKPAARRPPRIKRRKVTKRIPRIKRRPSSGTKCDSRHRFHRRRKGGFLESKLNSPCRVTLFIIEPEENLLRGEDWTKTPVTKVHRQERRTLPGNRGRAVG